MAHGLGKIVAAGGVRRAEEAEMLIDMQCDSLQGWYFSKACDLTVLPSVISLLPEWQAAMHEPPA